MPRTQLDSFLAPTRQGLRALHRQGVGLFAGTDAASSWPEITAGFSIHDELAHLVDVGLTPLVDIRNSGRIRAVVANGRYSDRAALDALIARVEVNAEQAPYTSGVRCQRRFRTSGVKPCRMSARVLRFRASVTSDTTSTL